MYIVYGHRCKINGKWYVGQSSQGIDKRSGVNGVNYLKKRKNNYCNPKFANAILKYGWDNFEHIILEDNISKEEIDAKETFWISEKDSYNSGYNASPIGNSCHFLTESQREKVSKKSKSIKWSNERREHMSELFSGESNPFYGKKHSDVQKEKWSKDRRGENSIFYGKHLSEETKKKIADAQRGILSHNYGKHLSNDVKRKISAANIGKVRYSKKVAMVIDDRVVMSFNSAADAARYVGLKCSSHIAFSCKGKTNNLVGGFKWVYTTEDKIPTTLEMAKIQKTINNFKKYKR